MKTPPLLSIVTPAFNEADNLPELHRRLSAALAEVEWEWIAVDDHSSDDTFAVLTDLARRDRRVRGVRLSHCFGSHAAILCGLGQARGKAAAVLAADLQDPPESVADLVECWRAGAQVVWAVRSGATPGSGPADRILSRLYYLAMRRVTGLREMPSAGTDFFLIDRVVIDALRKFGERHTSIFALVWWMGFRQERVTYEKQARVAGSTGWTMKKKIELLIDSVTAFSFAPLRMMSMLGVVTALTGFLYAAVVVANALAGHPPAGWSSLMVMVLVVGGLQMLMLGVLGEYVWRALSEARGRPRFLIEQTTDNADAPAAS
jgi:dolichol-phosphate mannosyltransferase